MRKCLVLLGTGLLSHAVLAVGCAAGEEGANVFIPETDASAEAASKGGASGDASTEAGKEGGAGTSGSSGASGAAGAGGSSGGSGASGAAGSGGSNTGGSNTGGSNTGGSNTGGSSTGGSSTGGSSTGGSSTGGSSTGGSSTGGSSTGGSSGAPAYSHTITIGSGNDFNANEVFLTTSSAYAGYVTWDQTHIYVGMDGPDIESSLPSRFLLVYIGIPLTAGCTTGFKYTGQQPGLPFEAHYLIAMKTDGSYQEAREYTGTCPNGQWATKTWDFVGHYSKSGSFFEAAIERQGLGSPAKVRIHVSLINETSGSEWTFAGIPTGSFTDQFNPTYSKFFEFDLTSSKTPKEYLPLP